MLAGTPWVSSSRTDGAGQGSIVRRILPFSGAKLMLPLSSKRRLLARFCAPRDGSAFDRAD